MDGEKEWITWHSIGIKRNQFFQTNFCAYGEAKQLAEKQDLNFIYIYIYIFFFDLFLNASLTQNGAIFYLKHSSGN